MTGFWATVCSLIIIVIIGFSNVEVNGEPQIHTGDIMADIKEYPWQAALYVDGKFVGSAAIIGPQHVITAARLVYEYVRVKKLDFISVVVGRARLTTDKGEEHAVQAIVLHPRFKPKLPLNHNLAILKLTDSIKFGGTQRAVRLPEADIAVGKRVSTSGWYVHPWETVPADLKKYDSRIISNDACDRMKVIFVHHEELVPKRTLRPNQVCTKPAGDIQVCGFRGNIGSPLVHKRVLVGINSWGNTCGYIDRPLVYTRIYQYVNWIRTTMKNKEL